MMVEKSLTQRLSETIYNYKFSELPEEVIDKACILLLDLVGCAIGASNLPESEIIRKIALEDNNTKTSTILGSWEMTSDINAAMANGFDSHILEMDDFHAASSQHPGITVIPTALAIAEKYGLSGEKLIEAIVAGYESVIRVGEALGKSHYYFWHTTSTAGCFGSTAAASKLLDLNVDQITDAFGSAGSQASGLWQFLEENKMTKYLHCGKANVNGIISAKVAKNGLTGASYILEGKRGLILATSNATKPEEAFESLGYKFKILETGIKPWASCRHTHSSIQACINLRSKYNIDYEDIDHIIVETYKVATDVAKNNDVNSIKDERSSKFSLTYCIALALVFGDVKIDYFSKYINDKRVLDLISKIDIKAIPEFDEKYPEEWNSRVTVIANDHNYKELVPLAKGEGSNPMTLKDVEDKFYDMASKVIGSDNSKILAERCLNIYNIDNVADLFKGLDKK